MALLIAALVFVAVFTLITGAAWVAMSKRRLLERLHHLVEREVCVVLCETLP